MQTHDHVSVRVSSLTVIKWLPQLLAFYLQSSRVIELFIRNAKNIPDAPPQ